MAGMEARMDALEAAVAAQGRMIDKLVAVVREMDAVFGKKKQWRYVEKGGWPPLPPKPKPKPGRKPKKEPPYHVVRGSGAPKHHRGSRYE